MGQRRGIQTSSPINPLRLNYVLDRASGLFGKKVLDVGCGGGILAESMAKEGAIVTGLIWAKSRLKSLDFTPLSQALSSPISKVIEDHAVDNQGQYDVVTCMEMLEHVPDPQSVVSACSTVKPGGHVFLDANRNINLFIRYCWR